MRWAGEDQGARQRPAGLEDLGVGKAQHDYWAAQGDAKPFIYVQGLGFRWRKVLHLCFAMVLSGNGTPDEDSVHPCSNQIDFFSVRIKTT